jgi:GT2 family glycosyltransferase
MILLYHKIFPIAKTESWVDVESFHRQMLQLRRREVVRLDEYDVSDPSQVVITFDDVYHNVLEYAAPFLYELGYPFELFISGDFIGGNDAFDPMEPFTEFATEEDLRELIRMGGRLQWHTRSHPNLGDETSPTRISRELTIPDKLQALDLKGMKWFAYPYGCFNDLTVKEVRERFVGAVSCDQGNNQDRYLLKRTTVKNGSDFEPYAKVGVIIPSYNYGMFLPETLESVLRQSQQPTEIHVADDCSDDVTEEVGRDYANRYPGLVQFYRNTHNLGIVGNFNAAVGRTRSDYIMILDADNRLPGNYVEILAGALDRNPDAAVAYTDFALFGPRASLVWKDFPQAWRGECIEGTFYTIRFPEFESLDQLRHRNFIHGNSLYRRTAFEQAGGYREAAGVPEDFDLFLRMIALGWSARRCAGPLLEYRQHSSDQAQSRLVREEALNWYRRRITEADQKLAQQDEALRQLQIAKNRAESLAAKRRILLSNADQKLAQRDEAMGQLQIAKNRAESLAAERLNLLQDRETRLRQLTMKLTVPVATCTDTQSLKRLLDWTRDLADHRLKLLRIERELRQQQEKDP